MGSSPTLFNLIDAVLSLGRYILFLCFDFIFLSFLQVGRWVDWKGSVITGDELLMFLLLLFVFDPHLYERTSGFPFIVKLGYKHMNYKHILE